MVLLIKKKKDTTFQTLPPPSKLKIWYEGLEEGREKLNLLSANHVLYLLLFMSYLTFPTML